MVEDLKPPLDAVYGALADASRRAIVWRLAADGELKVTDVARPFGMSLNAVSKHIKVLERAGLIVRGQRAQYRPCAINAAPLAQVSSWAEQYRPVWESRFDRMDEYLNQLQQGGMGERDD